jgi:hypothetical protein
MRTKGGNKDRSVNHERWVADLYGGRRTSNSGASDLDPGDVVTAKSLIECKTTGVPGKPSSATLLAIFSKVADEAYAAGLEPAVALQYYAPENPLANFDGWVNLTVRLSVDDARHACG